MDQRLIEKLEVLDGSRARQDLKRAAARIADLEALLKVPGMKSSSLTSAPTADDFNALRNDIKAISDAVQTVALALRDRVIR